MENINTVTRSILNTPTGSGHTDVLGAASNNEVMESLTDFVDLIADEKDEDIKTMYIGAITNVEDEIGKRLNDYSKTLQSAVINSPYEDLSPLESYFAKREQHYIDLGLNEDEVHFEALGDYHKNYWTLKELFTEHLEQVEDN